MTTDLREQNAGGPIDERLSSPGLLLALLGRRAMRDLRGALASIDLSPHQYRLLAILDDHEPAAQRDLSAVTGTDPSVLVTMLNPLEADGLVCRERDPEDRRRHRVRLTAAGRERLVAAERAQRETEQRLFETLGAERREQLSELLIALHRGLVDTRGADPLTTPESTSCLDGTHAEGSR